MNISASEGYILSFSAAVFSLGSLLAQTTALASGTNRPIGSAVIDLKSGTALAGLEGGGGGGGLLSGVKLTAAAAEGGGMSVSTGRGLGKLLGGELLKAGGAALLLLKSGLKLLWLLKLLKLLLKPRPPRWLSNPPR